MDLIVTVPDDRVNFVKKLLRELNLSVKPAKAAKQRPSALSVAQQQQLAKALEHSLHQVELHQQGKITLPSAYDSLDEV
ncbi:hypothetical protein [Hymenobacter siberiensis]|uniref:hypothetical protein n=1 Tax=Hymenobacter siberiensis TaxID=2848396 RepID=UPI001C1E2828|nr:hypothetical protein [Hymenobacter siberiensis]